MVAPTEKQIEEVVKNDFEKELKQAMKEAPVIASERVLLKIAKRFLINPAGANFGELHNAMLDYQARWQEVNR